MAHSSKLTSIVVGKSWQHWLAILHRQFEKSKLPPSYKLGVSFSFLNKGPLINNTPDSKDQREKAWTKSESAPTVL